MLLVVGGAVLCPPLNLGARADGTQLRVSADKGLSSVPNVADRVDGPAPAINLKLTIVAATVDDVDSFGISYRTSPAGQTAYGHLVAEMEAYFLKEGAAVASGAITIPNKASGTICISDATFPRLPTITRIRIAVTPAITADSTIRLLLSTVATTTANTGRVRTASDLVLPATAESIRYGETMVNTDLTIVRTAGNGYVARIGLISATQTGPIQSGFHLPRAGSGKDVQLLVFVTPTITDI